MTATKGKYSHGSTHFSPRHEMGLGGQLHAIRAEKGTVAHRTGNGWALGPVWTSIKNRKYLVPTALEPHTVQPVQSHCTVYSAPVPTTKCQVNPKMDVQYLILFSSLSDDRSKAPSKTIPPHSAIQSLLFQIRVSSPVLKVIQ